ncbi:hypothetical protein MRB53_003329 [Persea americana]|uniref:Uncharacterized protein n=1 Tax=Persea americana TaxID=3435 RepID=A0ACC2MX10_PERAE|nr:hypothetical protein MRB53_003329 [Persea americana]
MSTPAETDHSSNRSRVLALSSISTRYPPSRSLKLGNMGKAHADGHNRGFLITPPQSITPFLIAAAASALSLSLLLLSSLHLLLPKRRRDLLSIAEKAKYRRWLMQRTFSPLFVTMELEWLRLDLLEMMLQGRFSLALWVGLDTQALWLGWGRKMHM